jgi:hypothetical protein
VCSFGVVSLLHNNSFFDTAESTKDSAPVRPNESAHDVRVDLCQSLLPALLLGIHQRLPPHLPRRRVKRGNDREIAKRLVQTCWLSGGPRDATDHHHDHHNWGQNRVRLGGIVRSRVFVLCPILFKFCSLASILRTDSIPKDTQIHFGQWEKDYARKELDDSTINEMYTDMGTAVSQIVFCLDGTFAVLQYSFIAFFNSSLPVIGLIALLHNLLKMQHDAYRFLRLYRRPVLDKAADIQGWNHILRVVTVVGTISNVLKEYAEEI